MEFILVLAVIWAVWYFSRQNKSVQQNVAPQNVEQPDIETEEKEVNYTEEQVLSYQASFEQKIQDEIDFPDAIRGEELYIYKELVKPWFQKLAAKYRYDAAMIQKIRNDFFEYMYSMRDLSTTSYLGMEFDGEKGEEYSKRARQSAMKVRAIEDGFAAYMGEEAEEKLKAIRDMDFSDRWHKFSKFGEMAPEGKEYDLSGNLVDKKK